MTANVSLAAVKTAFGTASHAMRRPASEAAPAWFVEELAPGLHQRLRIDRMIHQEEGLQKIAIFENAEFGRVLALDDVIQVTERDEFIYHEMMAHVPLLAHGEARRVLIIGGGDGGMLREVLKHRTVERAVLVEIDEAVVALCRKHLPMVCGEAFEDPRTELVIADGFAFVRDTDERFDLILIDSPDPQGPGEILFSEEFYRHCRDRLAPGGVIVAQAGSPFFQTPVLRKTVRRLKPLFRDVAVFTATVPAYGGLYAFAWASDDMLKRNMTTLQAAARFSAAQIETRSYTPAVHCASFILPGFMREFS